MTEEEIIITYRRCFALLRNKCSRMLGETSDAQDIAQETFFRFCQKPPKDHDTRSITAWLYRTATRLAIERQRRLHLSSKHALQVAQQEKQSDLERRSMSRFMLEKLATLVPQRELEVAVLCRADGLTQREAAEVLNVAERTVRRLISRFDARVSVWRQSHSNLESEDQS